MTEEERRRSRRRKSAAGRKRTSQWLPLSPVRIWARGEAEQPSVGGGENFLWGLQQLKTRWREKERQKNRESDRNQEEADFLAYFGPDFLLLQAIKSTSIYRRWKRAILSILEKNFSP
jgi:hypothetical protein